MTSKVTNLRVARKRKGRAAARDKADANAARHGQTKASRMLCSVQDDLEQRRLDGHKLGDGSDEPE
ncbi:MAG TPA: DUF4169 family protein [Thermohalobaculum sp.]|nr:DUF4169 family protein [Thermohalobaculum sp.]